MARGHLRRRSSGWAIVVELPRDPVTGRRKQKWESGFPTRAAAQARLNELLAEVQGPGYAAPANLTTGQLLARWLAWATKNKSAPTVGAYEQVIRCHLVPALGAVPLPRLTPLHVLDYYDRSPLSSRTLAQHHSILRQALAAAVQWGLLKASPMGGVARPRFQPPRFPILEPDQARALLAALSGTVLLLPVLLAAGCGLRRGEALGLEWGDVGEAELLVRQQKARGGSLKAPKGGRPRRVAVPPFVAEALSLARQPAGRVCLDETGNPLPETRLRVELTALLERLGLPHVRYHSLRHLMASLLLADGEQIRVVQERLGHASPAITLAVYAHLLPGADQAAASRLDRLLGGPCLQREGADVPSPARNERSA